MQDYAQFLKDPVKSQADFLALATLRYQIHVAVAQLEDEEDLRSLLSLALAAKGLSVRGNS